MEEGKASPEGNASGAGGAASTAGREDEVVLGSVSMFGSLDRSWNVDLPKSLEVPVGGASSQPRFPAMRNTFPWSCFSLILWAISPKHVMLLHNVQFSFMSSWTLTSLIEKHPGPLLYPTSDFDTQRVGIVLPI